MPTKPDVFIPALGAYATKQTEAEAKAKRARQSQMAYLAHALENILGAHAALVIMDAGVEHIETDNEVALVYGDWLFQGRQFCNGDPNDFFLSLWVPDQLLPYVDSQDSRVNHRLGWYQVTSLDRLGKAITDLEAEYAQLEEAAKHATAPKPEEKVELPYWLQAAAEAMRHIANDIERYGFEGLGDYGRKLAVLASSYIEDNDNDN